MSTKAYPIRCLGHPDGIRVEVLTAPSDGYVRVRSLATGRSFETLADRLHKPLIANG